MLALQAFRHLYVLATQPRFVEAIDVDSRASVYVPLSITTQVPALRCICLHVVQHASCLCRAQTFCDVQATAVFHEIHPLQLGFINLVLQLVWHLVSALLARQIVQHSVSVSSSSSSSSRHHDTRGACSAIKHWHVIAAQRHI